MHPTALVNAKAFFDNYAGKLENPVIVDIGAQDVNGSLKSVAPSNARYIGVDFVNGKGVDVILDDPYKLPFDSESADIVVSNSCFEHSEMFWVLFLEIMRILKPSGLFYLNAPSNGPYHKYPVDCWRFYPDSGKALVAWAARNGYNPELLESYTSSQCVDLWNDFVAVILKDTSKNSLFSERIINSKRDIFNGYSSLSAVALKPRVFPQNYNYLVYFFRRCFRRLAREISGKK